MKLCNALHLRTAVCYTGGRFQNTRELLEGHSQIYPGLSDAISSAPTLYELTLRSHFYAFVLEACPQVLEAGAAVRRG